MAPRGVFHTHNSVFKAGGSRRLKPPDRTASRGSALEARRRHAGQPVRPCSPQPHPRARNARTLPEWRDAACSRTEPLPGASLLRPAVIPISHRIVLSCHLARTLSHGRGGVSAFSIPQSPEVRVRCATRGGHRASRLIHDVVRGVPIVCTNHALSDSGPWRVAGASRTERRWRWCC
jgi:hypothetical protein